MTRIPRTHIEGAVYYVTSRGDNNRDLFKDEADYRAYLDLLKKYKEQYGFKLFSFVLMPNHLHLLIELKEGITISDIMHDLNANYTKYFNSRYQRKGHLFQERYKMVVAEKAAYLLYITAYIHLNPKLLNLVVEPKDYGYSSCAYYLRTEEPKNQGTNAADLTEEIKEVAALLGTTAFKSYEEFLKGVSEQEMELLGKDLTKKIILGSADFREKVNALMQETQEELTSSIQQPVYSFLNNRRFLLVGSSLVLVLIALSFGLYTKTLATKENLKKAVEKKDIELSTKVKEERQKVHKDLEEKYQADRVSYEAMAKRLEIERKKIRELEEKIK